MIGRRGVTSVVAGFLLAPSRLLAQRSERIRRIGVLMDQPENATSRERLGLFRDTIKALGWDEGRNLSLEVYWGATSLQSARPLATSLIASHYDVVLATGSPAVSALIESGASVPIVFTNVIDPIAQGFASSLARPGGKISGFTTFEFGLNAKHVEVMTEIVPGLRRLFVIFDPQLSSGIGQLDAIRRATERTPIEIKPVDARHDVSIAEAFAEAAKFPDAGIVVTGSPATGLLRASLVQLAAQARVPTIYPYGHFVEAGGLVAYGPSLLEPFAKAAAYVDRILRGALVGDLPIQAPTRYSLYINLNTARSLGLQISSALLARADVVIE